MNTPLEKDVFTKLANKDFDVSSLDANTIIQIGSFVVESNELRQKVLGRITSKMNAQELREFSDNILDSTGYKISPASLQQYRWVWNTVSKFDLPADLAWTALRAIAGTRLPQYWANKTIENGWSSPQLIREIKLAEGKEPKKRSVLCPDCGAKIEI